jgi:hypothetical protein
LSCSKCSDRFGIGAPIAAPAQRLRRILIYFRSRRAGGESSTENGAGCRARSVVAALLATKIPRHLSGRRPHTSRRLAKRPPDLTPQLM